MPEDEPRQTQKEFAWLDCCSYARGNSRLSRRKMCRLILCAHCSSWCILIRYKYPYHPIRRWLLRKEAATADPGPALIDLLARNFHASLLDLISTPPPSLSTCRNARQHHVQHLLQNIRVQLGAGDPLSQPHEGAPVQVHDLRPRLLHQGESGATVCLCLAPSGPSSTDARRTRGSRRCDYSLTLSLSDVVASVTHTRKNEGPISHCATVMQIMFIVVSAEQ